MRIPSEKWIFWESWRNMKASVTAGFIWEAEIFHKKMVSTQRPIRIARLPP